MPEDEYHAHEGSLSASGAKLLAPPAPCPAKFKHQQEKGRPDKPEFDFGHAAHRILLGKGNDIEVLVGRDGEPFTSMRTGASKEAAKAARAAGRVPMLATEYERAEAVAKSVREDPIIGPAFTAGDAEVSLFWPDAETGVIRRARFDWITPEVAGRRRIIVDLKTARTAEPYAFGRSAADLGYAISAANYVDGAIACGLADDPVFLLAVVEKTEPYVVTTFQADDDLLELGRALMRKAIHLYAECTRRDQWPGYVTDVARLELPGYYIQRIEDLIA
nr:PD-(D/E)XK nuclease-like domain-containing protein [Nocardioides soli]